jgi:hypothetical protein
VEARPAKIVNQSFGRANDSDIDIVTRFQNIEPTSKRVTRLRLLSRPVVVTATVASTRKRCKAICVGATTKAASAVAITCTSWVLELAVIFSGSAKLHSWAWVMVQTSELALPLLVEGTDNHVAGVYVGKGVECRAVKV